MRRGALFLMFCLFWLATYAQPKIEFEETLYDFGNFSEEEGFVNHSFKFKNVGNAPLIIINAKATCGCTVPSYPKAPIAPGETGVIDVKYSAIGRPGFFNKSIKIITNGEPAEKSLVIKGNVNSPADNAEFKYFINGLKLKTITYDMGNIVKGEKKELLFDTWNATDRPLTIKITNNTQYISVKALPYKLRPGERGKIAVVYDSENSNEWGKQIDEFLITSERPNSRAMNKKISILSNISEDFSKQGNKRPKAEIEKVLVNFGEVASLSPSNCDIKIKNNGNGTLIIRKVSSSSPAISVNTKNSEIKPNGTTSLKITLNPSKCKSRIVNETVTIITNDSEKSEINIQVTATLK